uniref:Ig-like domain-containing protein n=1 Tax=Latimeria chalumnae TaxID=7897 RepID=H3AFB0_LATCH
ITIIAIITAIVSFIQGVQSEVVLTQSGEEVRKAEESLTVSCKGSGFTFTDYHIYWYRQPPGQELNWLGVLWASGSINYNQAMKGRFTVSRENSNSMAYLQMNSLQLQDTAVYYCAAVPTVRGTIN